MEISAEQQRKNMEKGFYQLTAPVYVNKPTQLGQYGIVQTVCRVPTTVTKHDINTLVPNLHEEEVMDVCDKFFDWS